MKGRILGYSGLDFKGLITGHDGQRYDFVRIDWHGGGEPVAGMDVDFQTEGTRAKDVYPLAGEQPAQTYAPYGQPRQPYGQPAQPQAPYGQPQQPYGQPYGQPQAPYGQPQQTYQPYGQGAQTYPRYGQPPQPQTQRDMGFGEAVQVCFQKYVTFSGRARRAEYWYFALFSFLAQIVTTVFDLGISQGENPNGPFSVLLGLGLLLPSLAVLTRRMHDTDRSGLWVLAFYGGLFFCAIVMFGAIASQHDAPEPTPAAATVIGLFALAFMAGAIWLLVLVCTKGTTGPNRYGPDPLFSQADAF